MDKNADNKHLFDQEEGIVRIVIDCDDEGGVQSCLGPTACGPAAMLNACHVLAALDVLHDDSLLSEKGQKYIEEMGHRRMMEIMGQSGGLGGLLAQLMAGLESDEGEGSNLFDALMNDDIDQLFDNN